MSEFLIYFLYGFVASFVDGCVGMSYGVFMASFLSGVGFSPLSVSSMVHFCEIFTSFASGLSHFLKGNIDFGLLKKILVCGVCGSLFGVFLLLILKNINIKPIVSIYLLILGFLILKRTFAKTNNKNEKNIKPLSFFGGLLDAIGGGGWGPIVTSSLIFKGINPNKVIGTVNFSEFFITLTQVLIFVFVAKITSWKILIAIITGGVVAAPLSALVVNKINHKVLMFFVSITIILINLFVILKFIKRCLF